MNAERTRVWKSDGIIDIEYLQGSTGLIKMKMLDFFLTYMLIDDIIFWGGAVVTSLERASQWSFKIESNTSQKAASRASFSKERKKRKK